MVQRGRLKIGSEAANQRTAREVSVSSVAPCDPLLFISYRFAGFGSERRSVGCLTQSSRETEELRCSLLSLLLCVRFIQRFNQNNA